MSILDILTNGPLGGIVDVIKSQGGLGNMGGFGGRDTTGGFGDNGAFGRGSGGAFGGGQGGFGGLGDAIGSVLQNIGNTARTTASEIGRQTPGGMGGLLGAGALGAVLGNLMSSSAVKGVALAGAGAVAYNFYKKWAAAQKQAEEGQESADISQSAAPQALPAKVDPTAELVLRSMIYAARADGHIDDEEKGRIDAILKNMFPGQNVQAIIDRISREPLDPAAIAREVKQPEQADDVYRLSCATIDIDQFMERSYLDGLAKALNLSPDDQKKIETEAQDAKKQLQAAVA